MEYVLIWNSRYGIEIIDSFKSLAEAKAMVIEYQMAYGGTVTIKKRRVR